MRKIWEKKRNARAWLQTKRTSPRLAGAGTQRSEEREIIQEEAKKLGVRGKEKTGLHWLAFLCSVWWHVRWKQIWPTCPSPPLVTVRMMERRAIMVDKGLFRVFVEKVGVFASMGGIKLRGLSVCVHVCAQR